MGVGNLSKLQHEFYNLVVIIDHHIRLVYTYMPSFNLQLLLNAIFRYLIYKQ